MKIAVPLVITAFFLVSGCATSRAITNPQQELGALDRLEREAMGRNVVIRAQNGQHWMGVRLVQVRPDTMVWTDEDGRRFRRATRDLASITYRQRGKGLAIGAAVGLGLSTAVAGLTYLLQPEGSGTGWLHFDRGENALLNGVAMGVLAVPIGSLMGGLNGYKVTYRFNREASSGESPSAAPNPQHRDNGL